MKRILFVPDCHIPNEDEDAWNVMMAAAKVHKPDVIVLLGDFLDGESLSAHPPDKPGRRDLQEEIAAVTKRLDELGKLGAEDLIYISGNHEWRLERYLAKNAPAIFNCVSIPQLLSLKERGWKWVPYRKTYRIGKLHITHDLGRAGMNAHRHAAQAYRGNAIIGHVHLMSYEVRGTFEDSPFLSASFGWLGAIDKAGAYLHEANAAAWVHGFGLGWLESTGVIHVQPVPIVNKGCCIYGRLIK